MNSASTRAHALCAALFFILPQLTACAPDRPPTSPTATSQPIAGESKRLRIFALRLKPHQDLKHALLAFAKEQNIRAGFIISAVGSLNHASLRLADQPNPTTFAGKQEIVSLTGTLSRDACHLHLAVSDATGKTTGGHLVDGCEIYTTAEIIIGNAQDLLFTRTLDPQTGYQELLIQRSPLPLPR